MAAVPAEMHSLNMHPLNLGKACRSTEAASSMMMIIEECHYDNRYYHDGGLLKPPSKAGFVPHWETKNE